MVDVAIKALVPCLVGINFALVSFADSLVDVWKGLVLPVESLLDSFTGLVVPLVSITRGILVAEGLTSVVVPNSAATDVGPATADVLTGTALDISCVILSEVLAPAGMRLTFCEVYATEVLSSFDVSVVVNCNAAVVSTLDDKVSVPEVNPVIRFDAGAV